MSEFFRKFARVASDIVGSPYAFMATLIIIIVWAISGPFFHFSDTWQLLINTSTTIATSLIVFLIQNTQNRDSKAIHLKLDELLRAVESARTQMVDLEDRPDEELQELADEFKQLTDQVEEVVPQLQATAKGAAAK